MRAGALDHRVKIEQRNRLRDTSSGEMVDRWDHLGEIWAERLEGTRLERYVASQVVGEVSVGWRARYAPALIRLTKDRHRLVYGEQVHEIIGVEEIGRRQGVVILTAARTEGLNALGQAVEGGT